MSLIDNRDARKVVRNLPKMNKALVLLGSFEFNDADALAEQGWIVADYRNRSDRLSSVLSVNAQTPYETFVNWLNRFFGEKQHNISEIVILRGDEFLSAELIIDFVEFAQNHDYCFAHGEEVLCNFSMEKVTSEFLNEVNKQKYQLFPNGLLNGGGKYWGNKNRFWIKDKYRQKIFNHKSFRPYPGSYNIDLTRRCNLRCHKCSYHRVGSGIKQGWRAKPRDFPLQNLQAIVEKGHPEAGIYLSVSGESLLHPDFDGVLKYLKDVGRPFHYTSNGVLLDEAMVDKLIDHGLCGLALSLDGLDQETYQQIIPNSQFSEVKQNIDAAIAKVRARNIEVQMYHVLVPGVNEGQLDQFVDEYMARGANVNVLSYKEPDSNVTVDIRDMMLPGRMACIQPYMMMLFATDGYVSPCCRDYDGEMIVGDLQEETAKEIWSGDKMQKFRDALFSEGGKDMHPICQNCWQWNTNVGYYTVEKGYFARVEEDRLSYSHATITSAQPRSIKALLHEIAGAGLRKIRGNNQRALFG